MIKEGHKTKATYWGSFSVKKVVQLTKPVPCYSDVRGEAMFEPTLVQIEWGKAPSGNKHEFWFPYWITWSDNGKQRYGQGAPMIGEASLLELLKTAIKEGLFSSDFLHEICEAAADKLSFEQRN